MPVSDVSVTAAGGTPGRIMAGWAFPISTAGRACEIPSAVTVAAVSASVAGRATFLREEILSQTAAGAAITAAIATGAVNFA